MHEQARVALNSLDTFLSRRFRARRLTSARANRLGLPFKKEDYGWIIKTSISYDEQTLSIIILPTPSFPYEIPHVYVKPNLELLLHPHVEENGKLCVWDKQVGYDPLNVQYVEQLINDTNSLLEKITTKQLDDDFNRGFLSYWLYAYPSTTKVNSLCNLSDNNIKQVYAAYTKIKGIVFADSVLELKSWLSNSGVKINDSMISKSFLIPIEKPWKPVEYPKKLSSIIEIIETKIQDKKEVYRIVAEMLCSPTKHPVFLLKISTESGDTVVGMCTETNAFQTGNFGTAFHSPLLGNGFRLHRVYPKPIFDRSKILNLYGVTVERKEQEWALGRGANLQLNRISDHTIGIIGLGSVGSGVIPLLAKAGFSKFVLFDEDFLETANIGRHWLGEPYVNTNKAKAIAKELCSLFPWVEIAYTGNKNWYKDVHGIEKLNECDLIISATGEWESDVYLGELLKQNKLECPVLFCFTEAHAVATHCFFNPPGIFSYRNLFTNTGELLKPTTVFENDVNYKLPTCGGYYQPYGAIELSFGHSMIAEATTDIVMGRLKLDRSIYRIWAGSKSHVQSNGGEWNEDWISTFGELDEGSRVFTFEL